MIADSRRFAFAGKLPLVGSQCAWCGHFRRILLGSFGVGSRWARFLFSPELLTKGISIANYFQDDFGENALSTV